ncbi:hypothetical protein PROFUN_11431 [Planoprotostelium fungivorum]|uniref:Uncharacterized protein n=1 Tax=Planoprotostelium fungivorum TaxID=1890364 RepID=A0A2P6NA96_9EUKA|nr:hypothetical protein PROFUN_11431 [Planoprotostelium fungivorum]
MLRLTAAAPGSRHVVPTRAFHSSVPNRATVVNHTPDPRQKQALDFDVLSSKNPEKGHQPVTHEEKQLMKALRRSNPSLYTTNKLAKMFNVSSLIVARYAKLTPMQKDQRLTELYEQQEQQKKEFDLVNNSNLSKKDKEEFEKRTRIATRELTKKYIEDRKEIERQNWLQKLESKGNSKPLYKERGTLLDELASQHKKSPITKKRGLFA